MFDNAESLLGVFRSKKNLNGAANLVLVLGRHQGDVVDVKQFANVAVPKISLAYHTVERNSRIPSVTIT
jgi:hypothetical protein